MPMLVDKTRKLTQKLVLFSFTFPLAILVVDFNTETRACHVNMEFRFILKIFIFFTCFNCLIWMFMSIYCCSSMQYSYQCDIVSNVKSLKT